MKKKLLALAVAAALPMVSQAATADVTIYGKVHTSIDYINPDARGADSIYDVTSRASRLGFKGSEDLGDGLKLIWKMETSYNTAEGGFGSGRNTYIGLAGGWGTFLYGRHDTPMKMSTGKLDIFADELADFNATAGLIDLRANDAIAYVSPSFGGLTLVGAMIPDADYDGNGDIAGAYSLAAMYSNGGLFVSGSYESLDNLQGGADASSYWRIGAGFDMGAFHIGAVYADQTDDDLRARFRGGDAKNLTVNGSWAFGNNKLKAMWGRIDSDNDVFDEGKTDAWAVGLDHNFSKRTKMYIQYADSEHGLQSTNYESADQSGVSFGMVHKF
ncbi:porin [Thiolapillus sp.]|uniref:porin n=1 Tax=Thiolapillus sp. TaxID=2017437 RepID=UPI003AF7F6BE